MKKTRTKAARFVTVLLTLCMVLALILTPELTASADYTNAKVASVALSIPVPKIGDTVVLPTITSVGVSLDSFSWLDEDWNSYTVGDKFIAGKTYHFEAYLKAKEGYEIPYADIIPATVNGAAAGDYIRPANAGYSGCCRVDSVDYYVAEGIVSSVTITKITAPVAGQLPVKDCVLSGSGYTLSDIGWYNVTDQSWQSGVYEAGKTYRVMIYLEPKDGYSFADIYAMKATINACTATTYEVSGKPKQRVVYLEFTVLAADEVKAQKPNITVQPIGGSYFCGTAATLSVTANITDGGTLSYQWYQTSMNDISTIRAIYSDTDVSYGAQRKFTTPQDVGTTYYCVMVENTLGSSSEHVYSDLIPVTYEKSISDELKVGYPSVITSPESVTVYTEETVTLSAYIKPIGEGELYLQWYKSSKSDMSDAVIIYGATSNEYIPEATIGTTYYRIATYMEYNGEYSEIVYTKTASVTYTKFESTVESIEIQNKPTKLNYDQGETLNTAGMTLRVIMSDGYKNVTSGFTCSPSTLNTVGTQSITVTYEGKTAVFDVVVNDSSSDIVLTGIEVLEMPKKTIYEKGETFDPDELILKLNMSDGWLQGNNYNEMTFSPLTLNTVGTQQITVTYKGKTTEFYVTVNETHTHTAEETWKNDDANHWKECSCGEKLDVAVHNFGEWETVTAATESQEGIRQRTCCVCGYSQSEIIAKINTVPTAAPETDPTDLAAPETDPTDLAAPETEPTDSAVPETEPTTSAELTTEPTDSAAPETEPTKAAASTTIPDNHESTESRNLTVLWIVLGTVLLGGGVTAVVLIIRKKKKQ